MLEMAVCHGTKGHFLRVDLPYVIQSCGLISAYLLQTFFNILLLYKLQFVVPCSGVVDGIPIFQPRVLGSIPGGVRDFRLYSEIVVYPLSVFCPVLSVAVALALAFCLP